MNHRFYRGTILQPPPSHNKRATVRLKGPAFLFLVALVFALGLMFTGATCSPAFAQEEEASLGPSFNIPPAEVGPCSLTKQLCSVDPETGLEPVNSITYTCPWGLFAFELPWACPGQ